MGLLHRIRREGDKTTAKDKAGVDAAIERLLALHPQLGLARSCQKRLAPAVAASLAHVRALVDAVPAAREASAAAWDGDPYIHAWFGAPDDVASRMSRSAELRAFFAANGDAPEAYAVLGMELTERHILGARMEGETMRRDVPQTTVSFSDHQVRMCGRDDAELREEIVRRLLDELALAGLGRGAADKSRRTVLERERALLKTRLQLLERQGQGIRSVIGGDVASDPGELARLQAQVEENARDLAGLGLREDALERELEHVRAVFAQPERHLSVSTRRLSLDRMNVVIEPATSTGAPMIDLEFRIARLPTLPPRARAFSLVRFARTSLLPETSVFEEAEQLLSSGLWS
ncbi:hypothetical protein [Massilia sp. CFBP9026]|uniref:hypothetical protein n=1 Tax=Massilia sp. CFBP9026 TaxID=3096536 RepID=UPI002A6A4440|nr:hypothetical protein [Massilia sp. CFBP9026]MDY0960527.1 hypothetical protein [Massilia sp. CFBP9026]